MRPSDFVLRLLAVDRVTQLVTEDMITQPARDAVARWWPESNVAYLVNCRACVSVWAGLAVSSGLIPRRVISALAFSSAVLMLDRQDERLGSAVTAYVRRSRGVS